MLPHPENISIDVSPRQDMVLASCPECHRSVWILGVYAAEESMSLDDMKRFVVQELARKPCVSS
jgi:hypothetical protein